MTQPKFETKIDAVRGAYYGFRAVVYDCVERMCKPAFLSNSFMQKLAQKSRQQNIYHDKGFPFPYVITFTAENAGTVQAKYVALTFTRLTEFVARTAAADCKTYLEKAQGGVDRTRCPANWTAAYGERRCGPTRHFRSIGLGAWCWR